MSQTLHEIYVANPSTTMISTDLIWIQHSPYTAGSDSAIVWSDLQLAISAIQGLGFSGTTISSTTTNANIYIAPNGTGDVFIGSSTSIVSIASTMSALQLAANSTNSKILVGAFNNSTAGASVSGYKSRSTSIGSFSIVQTGDSLMTYNCFADDGSTFIISGAMQFLASGAVSAGIVPTEFKLFTNNSSGVSTQALLIDNAQVATFTNAIVSDNGINFGEDTLTNYQEGTWTPVFTCLNLGDLSVVYTNQTAMYTRIGRMVYITLTMSFTPTFTTATGQIRITGLPFTSNATPVSSLGTLNTGGTGSFTYPVGTTNLKGQIIPNVSYIVPVADGSGINSISAAITNYTSGVASIINATITYFV